MKKIKDFGSLCNSYGFTLAEVLITLSILGVVAAILIPNTIQRITDRQTVTAVKKAYSMIDNALQIVMVENNVSDLQNLDWPYKVASEIPEGYLDDRSVPNSKYILELLPLKYKGNIIHYRDYFRMYKGIYKLGNKNSTYNQESLSYTQSRHLANGMTIGVMVVSIDYFDYWRGPHFFVDVNGAAKGPNRYGYDVFVFSLGHKGLSPVELVTLKGKDNCNIKNPDSIGWTCSEWILKHNNMDYKYRDVSAEW